MRIYRFDAGMARAVAAHGSTDLSISEIVRLRHEAAINCLHIGPNGLVGYHQAVVSQLFLVVRGEGWVRGEGEQRIAIHAGQAAFWRSGEWHESGSDLGMMVMVIEASDIDPDERMQPLDG